MDTSEGVGAAAAAAASPATAAAAAASTPPDAPSSALAAAPASSASAPSASPAPTPADEDEEDALINDNFDEEDLTDVKEPSGKKRGRGRPPAAASAASSVSVPADALERLNDLLQRTEQFAKFVPTKAEMKKGSARRDTTRVDMPPASRQLRADFESHHRHRSVCPCVPTVVVAPVGITSVQRRRLRTKSW
jgi:hypothetical protein